MRPTWKRAVVGLLIAAAVGGAALGLARPGDPPPTFIPHTEEPEKVSPPDDFVSVVQAKATEQAPSNNAAVALEWTGPAVVKANQPTEYTLTARNLCGQTLQKVVVQVRAPKGVEITGVSPAVKPIDGVYLWELDTLDAKTSKAVAVTLRQPAKGEMTCQAWVTLTGTSAMKAAVKEPKLEVKIKAPETVVIGDTIPIEYAVSNSGDHPAQQVAVKLSVPGFEKKNLMKELKPGDQDSHRMNLIASKGGTFTYEAVATGEDGLTATARTSVRVLMPKLDVKVTGPAERLIGTKGRYTVTVSNPGEVPVSGVTMSGAIPVGFKVCDTGAATLYAGRLTWSVDDLPPGKGVTFAFEGVSHTAGQLTHKVEATGDRDTKATGECVTTVEGIPGLRMELVDSADPVERGGEITYEIKVTNTGTKADTGVKIVCDLPLNLKFVSCSGPTKGQFTVEEIPLGRASENAIVIKSNPTKITRQIVTFDPISDLAPKTEAVFKVKVKGLMADDVRFKAVMTSKHLTTPVTKEESTRVYGE